MRLRLSVALAVLLVLSGLTVHAVAAAGSTVRTFLVGMDNAQSFGMVCADNGCPDVARADVNGDTITMVGSGSVDTATATASGSGTFVHRTAAGTEVAHGTWRATRLINFDSFGQPFGSPLQAFEGGIARVNVHLTPSSGGAGHDAILTITCEIGSVPSGHHEGIRLNVQDA